MRLIQKEIQLPVKGGYFHLLENLQNDKEIRANNNIPIRLVVTEMNMQSFKCEVSVVQLEQNDPSIPAWTLFDFKRRQTVNNTSFNVVFLVPTGIGSHIGGHAGDATPAAMLVSEICDKIILHPNVVNASDINEMPVNSLYVEGSTITRLLMGQIGIQPVRSNRLLVLIDEHHIPMFTNDTINAVSAARATYGLDLSSIIKLDPQVEMKTFFSGSGSAVGEIDKLERIFSVVEKYTDSFDALAVASVIETPHEYHEAYFKSADEMTNPWGGVEAMLTHTLSMFLNLPTAHSPMLENLKIANLDLGIVDPRLAAEATSLTFLQCMLKGLRKSPRIILDEELFNHGEILSAKDISCIVIPDKCVGLPTLAALEQGISVIAVRENENFMKNDLSLLPWKKGQLHIVDNYWEAVGVLSALKAGIDPYSVRRPLSTSKIQKNVVK